MECRSAHRASSREGGTIATMTSATPVTAPYGSWTSPISPHLLAEGGLALGGLQAVDGRLFWLEMRPVEGGRYVLVQRTPNGSIADVTPPAANARTLVHEYGGGPYALHAAPGGVTTVVFSEFADQRLYRQEVAPNGVAAPPQPLTPPPPAPRALRYADARVTPDGRSLIAVRERHETDNVANELVRLALEGDGSSLVLDGDHDFCAAPRLSPDGRLVAWLSWDFPDMPWDSTQLWVAPLTASGLGERRLVAGGSEESILQPAWDADGRLHFISDRSGWWNLYRVDDPCAQGGEPASATALAPLAAEFAKAPWTLGMSSYAFLGDGRIICIYSQDGHDHLGLIQPLSLGVQPLPCAFTVMSGIAVSGDLIAVIGGTAAQGPAVALYDLAGGSLEVVRRGTTAAIDPACIAAPHALVFPTSYEPGAVHGPLLDELERSGGELFAHALHYPPTNPDFQGPPDELPPLIVMCHGGPTSAREAILSLDVQFWTSRGCAVVDVNYGGSTGYGRAYRERLRYNWGVVDTVDCINAARHRVARGDADPARIAIQGGSAGGYTTLNALARHDFFAAGASSFGISDLAVFADGGTHKYESQYFYGLLGRYPEHAARYHERSPINHIETIRVPLLLLQGLEDAIVPPHQSELIAAELRARGLPFAYLAFAGEQHGFRKAETIVRAFSATLSFYGRVFGFTPADSIEPLPLENLD